MSTFNRIVNDTVNTLNISKRLAWKFNVKYMFITMATIYNLATILQTREKFSHYTSCFSGNSFHLLSQSALKQFYRYHANGIYLYISEIYRFVQ